MTSPETFVLKPGAPLRSIPREFRGMFRRDENNQRAYVFETAVRDVNVAFDEAQKINKNVAYTEAVFDARKHRVLNKKNADVIPLNQAAIDHAAAERLAQANKIEQDKQFVRSKIVAYAVTEPVVRGFMDSIIDLEKDRQMGLCDFDYMPVSIQGLNNINEEEEAFRRHEVTQTIPLERGNPLSFSFHTSGERVRITTADGFDPHTNIVEPGPDAVDAIIGGRLTLADQRSIATLFLTTPGKIGEKSNEYSNAVTYLIKLQRTISRNVFEIDLAKRRVDGIAKQFSSLIVDNDESEISLADIPLSALYTEALDSFFTDDLPQERVMQPFR